MDQPHPMDMGEAGRQSVVGTRKSSGTTSPRQLGNFPSPTTVHGRVLGALLSGDHLTHNRAQAMFGTSRLAAHIHRLRTLEGWRIRKVIITVPTRDHGRSARIAEYWIAPPDIANAGEAGRHYANACKEFDSGQGKA